MPAIPTVPNPLMMMMRSWPQGYALTITMSGAGTVATYTVTIDDNAKTILLELST